MIQLSSRGPYSISSSSPVSGSQGSLKSPPLSPPPTQGHPLAPMQERPKGPVNNRHLPSLSNSKGLASLPEDPGPSPSLCGEEASVWQSSLELLSRVEEGYRHVADQTVPVSCVSLDHQAFTCHLGGFGGGAGGGSFSVHPGEEQGERLLRTPPPAGQEQR